MECLYNKIPHPPPFFCVCGVLYWKERNGDQKSYNDTKILDSVYPSFYLLAFPFLLSVCGQIRDASWQEQWGKSITMMISEATKIWMCKNSRSPCCCNCTMVVAVISIQISTLFCIFFLPFIPLIALIKFGFFTFLIHLID